MRIIQLLPTISYGDAVGNDTLAIQKILEEQGYETGIYAENIDQRLPNGTAHMVSELPELADQDIILYHASTGTDLNYKLPDMGGKKVMIYHNITPPEFFRGYSPAAEELTRYGLDGVRNLADKIDYCIADSEFNKNDLRQMGFTCPIDVCPILIPFEDYEKTPNAKVLAQYQEDGYTNILFVGRIAPNKKQEDVIRAFYCYKKRYNAKSRLFLVGSWSGMETYYNCLCEYVQQLGLEHDVIFTGHIKFDEILAYYHLADAFLCMSEHEGFGVPLVEAMYFHVPVVAYDCAAIPDTLGSAGLLLEDKSPEEAAAALNRLLTRVNIQAYVCKRGERNMEQLRYEAVAEQFLHILEKCIARNTNRIFQISSTISRGDAVSNDIVAFHNAIFQMNISTGIYTEIAPSGAGWEHIQPVSELPRLRENDIVIYHHATGTSLTERFANLPCKRVLVYHNVTPPEFFAPFDKNAEKSCHWGLRNLVEMRTGVDHCIADSNFNKQDLRVAGYQCPISVCPILIPFEDYLQPADEQIQVTYRDGCTNVVFVGRVAPNKKFEDIIAAFAEYKKRDRTARLFLVGSYDAEGKYYRFLRGHLQSLRVQDVVFTGHIPFSHILAYYKIADVFLCMSEHEGFCVPLVEAMFFQVPIVAYASTAIPETLGGCGVLLSAKDPVIVADAIEQVMRDKDYRESLIKKQNERLQDFSYDKVNDILCETLDVIGGNHER